MLLLLFCTEYAVGQAASAVKRWQILSDRLIFSSVSSVSLIILKVSIKFRLRLLVSCADKIQWLPIYSCVARTSQVVIHRPNLWWKTKGAAFWESFTVYVDDRGDVPLIRNDRYHRCLQECIAWLKTEYVASSWSLSSYWHAVAHVVHEFSWVHRDSSCNRVTSYLWDEAVTDQSLSVQTKKLHLI